jgi:ribonuclease R
MRDRLGEEYNGMVNAVTSFGLFVQLSELYVEGLIHITELGGEYYKFDELRQELRGERTGVRYAVGTKLRVQVMRVDLDGRRIEFRLVREGEAAGGAPRGVRERTALPGGASSSEMDLAAVKDADRLARRAARQAAAPRGAGKPGPSATGDKAGKPVKSAQGGKAGKAGKGGKSGARTAVPAGAAGLGSADVGVSSRPPKAATNTRARSVRKSRQR